MQKSLQEILISRLPKKDMILFLEENPEDFEKAVLLALSDDENLGWRAAWLVNSIMKKNDPRITKHIKKIINAVDNKNDGHQRELLRILGKMRVSDNDEGRLFDKCMAIWESINKSSSVRIIAFRIIASMLKKYPELKNEIEPLTQKQYYDNLSEGIKGSFLKLKCNLFH